MAGVQTKDHASGLDGLKGKMFRKEKGVFGPPIIADFIRIKGSAKKNLCLRLGEALPFSDQIFLKCYQYTGVDMKIICNHFKKGLRFKRGSFL